MTITALALAGVMAFWLPADAKNGEDRILECSTLEDGIKRLECFDAIAQEIQEDKDAEAAKSLGVTPNASSPWRVDVSQSKIDDSKTVVLSTVSDDTVSGRFNRQARPWLILRCLRNTTSAYINFDGLHMADIQGYGRVTFRVDKNKAFAKRTDVSTDNEALGFWSGGTSIPFIKQLFGGSVLLVQATPYSDAPITFSLDISGIEKEIEPLRKACHW